jgi:hypothetical protein
MFGNRRHFRELVAGSKEGIASNVLAHRLWHLVGSGWLTRAEAGPGQRANYSLPEPAIQLVGGRPMWDRPRFAARRRA